MPMTRSADCRLRNCERHTKLASRPLQDSSGATSGDQASVGRSGWLLQRLRTRLSSTPTSRGRDCAQPGVASSPPQTTWKRRRSNPEHCGGPQGRNRTATGVTEHTRRGRRGGVSASFDHIINDPRPSNVGGRARRSTTLVTVAYALA